VGVDQENESNGKRCSNITTHGTGKRWQKVLASYSKIKRSRKLWLLVLTIADVTITFKIKMVGQMLMLSSMPAVMGKLGPLGRILGPRGLI
jgi:ribosomal protein L1